jgi:hypothetical protein
MEVNSTTLEATAAPEAQPTAPETENASPEGRAQADKPASLNTPENAEKLRLIMRR